MVPVLGHLWLWPCDPRQMGQMDRSFILVFNSQDYHSGCQGVISDTSVIKGNWNHALAPSLTFEIRDDILALNKPKLFFLVECFFCASREDFCWFMSCFNNRLWTSCCPRCLISCLSFICLSSHPRRSSESLRTPHPRCSPSH